VDSFVGKLSLPMVEKRCPDVSNSTGDAYIVTRYGM
jgi:hypothetical protein